MCVCVCLCVQLCSPSSTQSEARFPEAAAHRLLSSAVCRRDVREPHHVVHILANGKRRASWQQEAPPPLLLLLPLPLQRLLHPANGGQLAGQVPQQSCGVIIMSFLLSRGSLCSAARSQMCFIKDEMSLKLASDQIHAVLATPPWLLHSRLLKYPMCVFLPLSCILILFLFI